MYLTNEQQVVVESRLGAGYSLLGKYSSMSGVQGFTVGLVKGKHRVHINALGYDEYQTGVYYKEVK